MSRRANLAGTDHNIFAFVARAHQAKSRLGRQRLLTAAKSQLAQARMVGWPALEQSLEQDVEVLQSLIDKEQA